MVALSTAISKGLGGADRNDPDDPMWGLSRVE